MLTFFRAFQIFLGNFRLSFAGDYFIHGVSRRLIFSYETFLKIHLRAKP